MARLKDSKELANNSTKILFRTSGLKEEEEYKYSSHVASASYYE
jgi:hypothetical protein